MSVLIVTEKELREVVGMDMPAIDAVADAFAWLSQGKVEMPPIMHIEVPEFNGDVDIKSAYVKGLEQFAVKIGAGFFDNYKLGLPSSPAMMNVVSSKTGIVEAILLDNAYLTDVRTAAAGAVAAKYLAPEKVDCAGVVGAGVQGRYQMIALKQVRDFKKIVVFDRDTSLLEKYTTEIKKVLDVEVIIAKDVEEVVQKSQVVVTCTPSKIPFIKPEYLHPGLHITAMGADLPEKQEIASEIFEKADVIACDVRTQTFKVGELMNAVNDGIEISEADVIELGEIITGVKSGRKNDDQITICDLSGTGVQDTAIANVALRLVKEKGFGIVVEN